MMNKHFDHSRICQLNALVVYIAMHVVVVTGPAGSEKSTLQVLGVLTSQIYLWKKGWFDDNGGSSGEKIPTVAVYLTYQKTSIGQSEFIPAYTNRAGPLAEYSAGYFAGKVNRQSEGVRRIWYPVSQVDFNPQRALVKTLLEKRNAASGGTHALKIENTTSWWSGGYTMTFEYEIQSISITISSITTQYIAYYEKASRLAEGSAFNPAELKPILIQKDAIGNWVRMLWGHIKSLILVATRRLTWMGVGFDHVAIGQYAGFVYSQPHITRLEEVIQQIEQLEEILRRFRTHSSDLRNSSDSLKSYTAWLSDKVAPGDGITGFSQTPVDGAYSPFIDGNTRTLKHMTDDKYAPKPLVFGDIPNRSDRVHNTLYISNIEQTDGSYASWHVTDIDEFKTKYKDEHATFDKIQCSAVFDETKPDAAYDLARAAAIAARGRFHPSTVPGETPSTVGHVLNDLKNVLGRIQQNYEEKKGRWYGGADFHLEFSEE